MKHVCKQSTFIISKIRKQIKFTFLLHKHVMKMSSKVVKLKANQK